MNQLPLALDFSPNHLPPPLPKFEPVASVDFEAVTARKRAARNQVTVDWQPPGHSSAEYSFDDPNDPRLLCDRCGFPLRPRLDYVWCCPGRRLCEDCLEDEVGIERFTADEWLEANPLTEWHKEPVESVINLSATASTGQSPIPLPEGVTYGGITHQLKPGQAFYFPGDQYRGKTSGLITKVNRRTFLYQVVDSQGRVSHIRMKIDSFHSSFYVGDEASKTVYQYRLP